MIGEAPTDDAAEAKAAFHLSMRARGIQDREVLRAFELVPRRAFVPEPYRDLAARDIALPIGCGQTLLEPSLVARMIMALDVSRAHRVLEVGAGTGYATAILSHLAGEVLAFERYRSLAMSARERLAALDIGNAAITWGDGLVPSTRPERFDRIIAHGCLDDAGALLGHLSETGILVCVLARPNGQHVARLTKTPDGVTRSWICGCRIQAIVPGLSATL